MLLLSINYGGRIVQKLSHGQLDSSQTMCLRTRKRYRAISTARLYVTIVHLQPINVVVYNDPQWKSNLGAGFALRCFQRLSEPNAATQHCPWRNN